MGPIRKSAVAGSFYPRFQADIKDLIETSFKDSTFGPGMDFHAGHKEAGKERQVLGGVCPHAGYIYSGCCSCHTLQAICTEGVPDTFIILGNVHTGYREISVMKEGKWETPMGEMPIDSELAKMILERCPTTVADDSAFMGFPHGREHNIEVQIPFLQYIAQSTKKAIKIVTIAVGSMDFSKLERFGTQLAEVLYDARKSKDIAIIASSDMTHHEPKNRAKPAEDIKWQYEKDNAVMHAFEQFDIPAVYKHANETTVCGPQTISSLMIIGKTLGYKNAKKLKYYTSYEKMGGNGPCDYSVGYFSGIIQ
jgi:AmmeMemoRadiSam system protein B